VYKILEKNGNKLKLTHIQSPFFSLDAKWEQLQGANIFV